MRDNVITMWAIPWVGVFVYGDAVALLAQIVISQKYFMPKIIPLPTIISTPISRRARVSTSRFLSQR